MNSSIRMAAILAALALATGSGLTPGGILAAQQGVVRPLDLGGPPGDTLSRGCLTDALLTTAVTGYNGPAVSRMYGSFTSPSGFASQGALGFFGGDLRMNGSVRGDIIVINADMRLGSTGRVEGDITVIGGRFDADPGSVVTGKVTQCAEIAPVKREPTGLLSIHRRGRLFGDVTAAAAAFDLGPLHNTLRGNVGTYNRTESLPLEPGITSLWQLDSLTSVRVDLTGILRTASDPSDTRSDLGWSGTISGSLGGKRPITVGFTAGSTVVPTADHATTATESGLSAALLRDDYRDWYQSQGVGVFATIAPMQELTLRGSLSGDRETTVRAVDAFSLLRRNEAWRPNPLVDDGRFHTLTLGATWDSRDDRQHPSTGLLLHGELRHVTSNDLTPVSLPTTIRNALPTTGYHESELDLDARVYLRINPQLGLALRAAAGGYLSGDPLTIQRRRAVGGLDPLPGYEFRATNCDRVRRPDPALPALCDRQMSMQGEVRRTVNLNLSTRIAGYSIGVQRPTLVAFGDLATAFLVGDSAGRVPSNKIQNINEWRSEVGVGIDAGRFGLYLAKALADPEPFRLVFRLGRRF